MVDTIKVNEAVTGPAVATDDIGGEHHQMVKMEWGAENSAIQVDDVDGSRLPVYSQGGAASDAPAAGNPSRTGGRASSATPSDVSADGDIVDFWLDRKGRQVVRLGDGTNLTPAGDAQARALHVRAGDGTNTTPAGDAVTRPIFVRPGDGTNNTPAGDAAARHQFVRHTDGTNNMPAGDALARPIFSRLSGPNDAALFPSAAALADAAANPTVSNVGTNGLSFNGSTWDRLRNNHEITILASAARTAQAAGTYTNYNGKGMLIWLHVTVAAGGGKTLTVYLQPSSAGAGAEINLRIFPAVTLVGLYGYLVYPGVLAGAVGSFSEGLNVHPGRTGSIYGVPSDATSWTYGIYCQLLL